MAISYQSRFLLFWRRQWHQWQRQQWQVKSTLSGVLQIITGILSQFLHQGLPQLRGTTPWKLLRLGSSSPPDSDGVTQAVTAAIHLSLGENNTFTLQLAPLPRRLSWWQRLLTPIRPPTPEAALGQREPLYLACDRQTHSLLLLNTTAVPLKIFTPDEQQRLEQRIYYELACYYRHLRQWYRQHHRRVLRQQSSPPQCLAAAFLRQLTITSRATELVVGVPSLSPLSQVWQRWRSRLPFFGQPLLDRVKVQGIASQMNTGEMVLIATDNSILYTLTPQQRQQVLAWIDRHLQTAAPLRPIQDWLSRASYWLAGLPPPLLGASSSPLLAAVEPMPTLPDLGSLGSQSPVAPTTVDANQLIIEVEAAFMGYELHWFEKLLLWCDRLLVWLEGQLAALSQWLMRRLGV